MEVKKEVFGKTNKGREVYLYTLKNNNGMTAKVTTFGGILVLLVIPDKDGNSSDVVMGYDSLEEYINDTATYFGSTVGRYAGHIVGAKFTLDGREYKLAANDGANHLHGGNRGYNKVVWDSEEIQIANSVGVELKYLSKDGEERYPGNLNVSVTYSLTDDNELRIDYEAVTDKATPVSLTNHSYFNLAGHGSGDVLSHELMIAADNFNPAGDDLAPTGEVRSVKNTGMDFTQPTAVGARIAEVPGGYDHNYALNNTDGSTALAASLTCPKTGRMMEVYTTEPALQFYGGNFLDGTIKGKGGAIYNKHGALCLEAQQFPDAPNNPHFPSAILEPNQKYTQKTIYKFMHTYQRSSDV